MFGNLKFDKMVDTGKAEEYMRSNGQIFHSIGNSDNDKYEYDICNNKIMFGDYRRRINFVSASIWNNLDNVEALSTKLKTLAESVEENKLLFAQIEFMLKGKPINESINIDLKLIVQNITYVSSAMSKKRFFSNVLVMHGGSPLATLGFVAQLLCSAEEVIIDSTPHTAVVCHLFVSLCRKAGLDNVRLVFVKESLPHAIDLSDIKELGPGCAGVVAERSDVDSAVDAFIASATQDPWKIRRILVQESVADRLEEVLDWKSKNNNTGDNLNDVKASECSSAYRVNDKLFIFEYTGQERSEDHVIIEAYRTVKELLSLFNTYKPFAVSLWCADVSQANEIAYGIDSSLTWINDYGSFYGPIKSSQAFYSIIDVSFSKQSITPSFDVRQLTTARDNWLKLSVIKRRELLKLAIKTAKEIDNKSELDVDIDFNVSNGNFVEVDNCGICVGLEVAALPVILFDSSNELNFVLSCLLKGFAVLYSELNQNLFISLIEVGAPLVSKGFGTVGEYEVASPFSQYKTKVVRTNFGTIFAN